MAPIRNAQLWLALDYCVRPRWNKNMGDDLLTKLHISHALGERSTRVASHIVETINRVLDLIDEQPTAVVEALIDYGKQKQSQEHRKPRHDLGGALVAYGQATLKEARARERRLLEGITGMSEPGTNTSS
jgi:hypothetical protein